MNLSVPLDKKADRNTLRSAQISLDQVRRSYELKLDNVRLGIIDDLRALDQAKRTYEINQISVNVSERRVEQQNLLSELGRTTARDVVEAQDSLTSAKNALTGSIISHTLARLQFYSDMGILMINDNGKWEEIANANNQ